MQNIALQGVLWALRGPGKEYVNTKVIGCKQQGRWKPFFRLLSRRLLFSPLKILHRLRTIKRDERLLSYKTSKPQHPHHTSQFPSIPALYPQIGCSSKSLQKRASFPRISTKQAQLDVIKLGTNIHSKTEQGNPGEEKQSEEQIKGSETSPLPPLGFPQKLKASQPQPVCRGPCRFHGSVFVRLCEACSADSVGRVLLVTWTPLADTSYYRFNCIGDSFWPVNTFKNKIYRTPYPIRWLRYTLFQIPYAVLLVCYRF